MGYYSEVYLGIEPALVEELLTFVGINKEVFNLMFKDTSETIKTKNGGMLFHWNHIKWYNSQFPEIEQLEDWLMEDDRDEAFKFIRMGEEYGDSTVEGHSDEFEFFPQQSIDVHY